MIFAIVEFLCLIVLGGFLYYFLNGIASDYLTSQATLFPSAFTSEAIAFTQAITHWLLLIMIIGGLFGLFVWVQRTRPEGYYGR